ncbi:hypothetical protein FJZ53_01385 [Candidatus Woesearchaeota archaeon]|nr:hypothetical protein [Candidatus Woesearchaeota archaeon]
MASYSKDRHAGKIGYIFKEYYKILKKFKNIGLEELNIMYSQEADKYAALSAGEYQSFLVIGKKFLTLSKGEMRAVIAHELGHYERLKDYSRKRFILTNLRDEEFFNYAKEGKTQGKYKHRFDMLKKWSLLHEIDADNKALKAGYGEPMLNILKSFTNSKEFGTMHPLLKEQMMLRMKSLEDKLRC